MSRFSLCLMFVGCGGGDPALVPVSGIVTLDGEPLQRATIEFSPASGGWGSQGRTDEFGRYELLYRGRKEGAVPGKHQVRITSVIEQDVDSSDPEIQQGRKESVPPKYNTASILEADLEPGSYVGLDFELESGNQTK